MKRTALKKISRSHASRMRKYYAIRLEWMRLKENQYCAICLVRGRERPNNACEVHHARGRNASLPFDTRFFIASCSDCGRFVHQFPRDARALGVLAERTDFDCVPR